MTGLYSVRAPGDAVRSRRKDVLLIHLSLSSYDDTVSALYDSLSLTLSNRFFSTSGSVTAALRRAIDSCHDALIAHNNLPQRTRLQGALTCAVLRDREAFIAQVGDGFAIVGHNFGLERLPSDTPPLSTPLGASISIDVRYYHNWLQDGDTLLLADPLLGHLPTQFFVPALAGTDVASAESALVELLRREAARVIVVGLEDRGGAVIPAAPPVKLAPHVQQAPTPTSDAPPRRGPVRDPAFVSGRQGERPAAPVALPAGPEPPHSADSPDEHRTGALDYAADEGQDEEEASHLDLEYAGRRAAATTLGGLSTATGWLARLLARLRTPADDDGTHPAERPLAIAVAVIIPIAVAIILTGVYIQRGEVSRLTQIQQELRILLDEAAAATAAGTDPRPLYDRAQTLIAEADTLSADDAEISRQRQDLRVALDRLDSITRLFGRTVHIGAPGSDYTRLVLAPEPKTGFFLVDEGNDRVEYVPSDDSYLNAASGEQEIVLEWNDVLGNHIVGSVVDMLWRQNASEIARPGLAMLDSSGAVITYNPTLNPVMEAATLALSSEWGSSNALAQFQGRVYVLDPARARIWRYFPDGDGFAIESGREAIELPDLDNALDSAIYAKDGSVMVAYADGALRSYTGNALNWDESRLAESDLSLPLDAPTRVKIIGDGFTSSIFVADPSTGRIVEMGPAGNILAQYRATAEDGTELFADIDDFDVAPSLNELRIFVVRDNVLSVATFSPD